MTSSPCRYKRQQWTKKNRNKRCGFLTWLYMIMVSGRSWLDHSQDRIREAAASPDDVPEALEAPEGEFKPILSSAPLSPEFRDAP